MNLKTCKEALRFVIESEIKHRIGGLPKPVLVGDSGVGKTATVRQIFHELVEDGVLDKNAVFIEKHLGQLELGDLIGLPDLSEQKTVWRAPCWWPSKDCRGGILFFDEFGDTKNDVQRAVQQLILEKQLYEHKLPDNMAIVLAMNPVGQEFGSFDFSRQLKNRLMFWRVAPDLTEWLEYADKNNNLIDGIAKVVASGGKMLLESVDFTVDAGFRNPRSITAAASLAKLMTPAQCSSFGFALFSSICGPMMAASLLTLVEKTLDVNNLPLSVDDITKHSEESVKKLKSWISTGKIELAYESVLMLKAHLKDAPEQATALEESSSLGGIIRFCEELPKDMLIDLLTFIDKESSKNLAMKIGMKSPKIFKNMSAILKS